MSILRELFVKLGMTTDAQSFATGALAAEGVKAALEKVVEAAKEVGRAFVENIQKTAEYGEQIKKLQEETGASAKSLQQLGDAAAVKGIGLDQMGLSLTMLSRQMLMAKEGSKMSADAFASLGVKVLDAGGKMRAPVDVLKDISNAFAHMKDGSEKTALAMTVFSRSGAQFIDFLDQGSAGIAKYELPALPQEQIDAGIELVESQRALSEQTQNLWRRAIGPLLPGINRMVSGLGDWLRANDKLIKGGMERFIKSGLALIK